MTTELPTRIEDRHDNGNLKYVHGRDTRLIDEADPNLDLILYAWGRSRGMDYESTLGLALKTILFDLLKNNADYAGDVYAIRNMTPSPPLLKNAQHIVFGLWGRKNFDNRLRQIVRMFLKRESR